MKRVKEVSDESSHPFQTTELARKVLLRLSDIRDVYQSCRINKNTVGLCHSIPFWKRWFLKHKYILTFDRYLKTLDFLAHLPGSQEALEALFLDEVQDAFVYDVMTYYRFDELHAFLSFGEDGEEQPWFVPIKQRLGERFWKTWLFRGLIKGKPADIFKALKVWPGLSSYITDETYHKLFIYFYTFDHKPVKFATWRDLYRFHLTDWVGIGDDLQIIPYGGEIYFNFDYKPKLDEKQAQRVGEYLDSPKARETFGDQIEFTHFVVFPRENFCQGIIKLESVEFLSHDQLLLFKDDLKYVIEGIHSGTL